MTTYNNVGKTYNTISVSYNGDISTMGSVLMKKRLWAKKPAIYQRRR